MRADPLDGFESEPEAPTEARPGYEPAIPPPAGPPARPRDPWAHRRGEPRLFAFFWTFYVLLSVAGSLTWIARMGVISVGAYGPAARIMLVVVSVGMIVLWPMTRLSQASPERNSLVSTLVDLIVVQVPVQIVIWPLHVLANWPLDIVAAVAAMMGAWGVLTAGVLALALGGREIRTVRDPRLGGRVVWTVVFVAAIMTAPIVSGLAYALGHAPPAWLTMCSPITAIPALTGRGLIGPGAPVSRLQWDTVIVTLSIALGVWSAAAVRNGLAREADAA